MAKTELIGVLPKDVEHWQRSKQGLNFSLIFIQAMETCNEFYTENLSYHFSSTKWN